MTVSSRTPEGLPHRCPVCNGVAAVEPSYPGGDACCPTCGHLLWWFRDWLGNRAGVDPADVRLSSSFRDLAADSLDMVELVMELEEEFDVRIPDDAAERMQTVEDVMRYSSGASTQGTRLTTADRGHHVVRTSSTVAGGVRSAICARVASASDLGGIRRGGRIVESWSGRRAAPAKSLPRVVVVGAGFAGLACADELAAAATT